MTSHPPMISAQTRNEVRERHRQEADDDQGHADIPADADCRGRRHRLAAGRAPHDRVEDPGAVHRVSRNQVDQAEDHVERRDHRGHECDRLDPIGRRIQRSEDQDRADDAEDQGDDEAERRAGKRDPNLLARVLRSDFHDVRAAEQLDRDSGDELPIAARDLDVSQLVAP
jgi:hypothetical protein